jgi:hypothetical protein
MAAISVCDISFISSICVCDISNVQCVREVFRSLDFFKMLLRYSPILKCITFFSMTNLHTIPCNDKAKTFSFTFFEKSFQIFCYDT